MENEEQADKAYVERMTKLTEQCEKRSVDRAGIGVGLQFQTTTRSLTSARREHLIGSRKKLREVKQSNAGMNMIPRSKAAVSESIVYSLASDLTWFLPISQSAKRVANPYIH